MKAQTVSVHLSDSAIHEEDYKGPPKNSFESLNTCSLMPDTQTQNAKNSTYEGSIIIRGKQLLNHY